MRAGFDISGLFWLVVIAASIIGQIMKAAKKHTDAAPGSPSAPRPDRPSSGEPAQELEEFLRNLMGEQAPRAEPPPVLRPAPRPAPVALPAQDPATFSKPTPAYRSATAAPPPSSRPEKRAYMPLPAVPAPREARARVSLKAEAQRAAPTRAAVAAAAAAAAAAQMTRPIDAGSNKALAALTAEVHRQIKTRESLRAALLLREILGPPVGLRDMQTKCT